MPLPGDGATSSQTPGAAVHTPTKLSGKPKQDSSGTLDLSRESIQDLETRLEIASDEAIDSSLQFPVGMNGGVVHVDPANSSSIVAYFLSSRLYWEELQKNAEVSFRHFEMQAEDEMEQTRADEGGALQADQE